MAIISYFIPSAIFFGGVAVKKVFLLLLALLLCGCTTEAEAPAAIQATEESILQETIDPSLEAAAMSEPPPPKPVIPETAAPGTTDFRCEEAVIDVSNTQDGYIMVQYLAETDKRIKVLLQGPTTRYSYNLSPGEWTVLPLSDGNGEYEAGIYINVVDKKYAVVMSACFSAEMTDEFAPFLRPNQYVNYTEATNALALGLEITQGMEDTLDKVAAVYDYVVSNLSYDYDRAATVKSGYLPDLDAVLAEKKGICFDYGALMTAMLRSQEIPCKLVVGYAGKTYHAWISVWTEEEGWIDGAIFFDGKVWHRMDPTFASSGAGDPEIMDFIQNGNYTVKYLY